MASSSFVHSFLKSKEKSRGRLGSQLIIISQEMSHHIARRGGKTHLATKQLLLHIYLGATSREVQASHGRGRATADYSNFPLYPFYLSILSGRFETPPRRGFYCAGSRLLCTSDIYTHFSGAIIQRRLGLRAIPLQAEEETRQGLVEGLATRATEGPSG